jgi:hypothetical protein
LPGRHNTSEAALLLGFQEHDIAPLIASMLLIPLGKPAANSPKYFAAVEVVDRAGDLEWLGQATKALARHWQRKNQRKQLMVTGTPGADFVNVHGRRLASHISNRKSSTHISDSV